MPDKGSKGDAVLTIHFIRELVGLWVARVMATYSRFQLHSINSALHTAIKKFCY